MEFIVFVNEHLGEEVVVAQAPVGVVAAGVDVDAVLQQVQGLVQVGAGLGVVAVVGVDASGDVVEFDEDAVLFSFEQGQRDRVGVVGLDEVGLFVLQPVAGRGEAGEFVGLGGRELVELVVEHPGEGFAAGGGDLDAVVGLDEFLDVLDEDRVAGAVGAFGVPTGADAFT